MARKKVDRTKDFAEFARVRITSESRVIVPPESFKVEKDLTPSAIMNTIETHVISDLVRGYVGAAMSVPTAGSGVYLNFDRVWLTQFYDNLAQYDLYDEILNDPHVEAVVKTLKYSISALEWGIEPGSENAGAKAAAEWCEKVLKHTPNFTQDLVELLDAVTKGFAASEILWRKNQRGEVVPQELLNIPQRRIQFDVGTRQPKLRTWGDPYLGRPLPEKKIIIHRSSQRYESPFGEALCQKIYWPWLFKRNVEKFWLTYTQNNAGPIPMATVPDNADKKLKDQALAFVAGLRSSGYGVKEKSITIDYAESKSSEGVARAFMEAIRHYNDEITKCVLGQILTTEGTSSSGGGARAGAQVSHELTKDRTYFYGRGLEDTLTTTILRWMCDFNFALDEDDYPRFAFDLSDAPDLQMLTSSIKSLSDAGFDVDPVWIKENTGIEVTVKPKPDPAQFIPGQVPQNGNGKPKPQPKPGEFSEVRENVMYLIQHGSTAQKDDAQGNEVMEGWSNTTIDEEGERYSQAVGELMKSRGIRKVYSSNLERSIATAQIIANVAGVPHEMSAQSRDMKGWDYGVFTGTTVKSAADVLREYVLTKPDEPLPSGESYNKFRKRTLEAARSMLLSMDGTIAKVGHSKEMQLVDLWIKSGAPDNLQVDGEAYLKSMPEKPRILRIERIGAASWTVSDVKLPAGDFAEEISSLRREIGQVMQLVESVKGNETEAKVEFSSLVNRLFHKLTSPPEFSSKKEIAELKEEIRRKAADLGKDAERSRASIDLLTKKVTELAEQEPRVDTQPIVVNVDVQRPVHQPKTKSIEVIRGADGRISGAEVVQEMVEEGASTKTIEVKRDSSGRITGAQVSE